LITGPTQEKNGSSKEEPKKRGKSRKGSSWFPLVQLTSSQRRKEGKQGEKGGRILEVRIKESFSRQALVPRLKTAESEKKKGGGMWGELETPLTKKKRYTKNKKD